ncbi:MAG: YceH family protein [Lentisphaerae bacterium]|nr:YceH family protein [Lentisphaerota bacterium]
MNENTEGESGDGDEAAGAVVPRLDPVEARVLACLVEKERTTPEYYPLTLKALTAACNQKSNRDPVMSLTEEVVTEALDTLRYEHHLVWLVDTAGSRTPKYKHSLVDTLGFDPHDLAVMCELMLRGPQTQGELRTHCSRLTEFESIGRVQEVISALEDWAGRPLVKKLPPGSGRREPRYAHLLCGEEGLPEASAEEVRKEPAAPTSSREARTQALEEQVCAMREELDALRSQFDKFRSQFE